MNKTFARIVRSAGWALLLAGTVTLAQAATNPVPEDSKAFGKVYSELAARWLEWVTAIPASSNPLFDPDGTFGAVGQSGKVWYLVGSTGGAAERSLTVPWGTALFFPIVNVFWVNTPEYGDPPWSPEQEQSVREWMDSVIDTTENLVLEIDGHRVRIVWWLRAGSRVGYCDMPATDNIFGITLNPGIHECVADGYWALLPPLSVGTHTIHFSGGYLYFGSPFALDVTYHIAVAPRKKGVRPVPHH